MKYRGNGRTQEIRLKEEARSQGIQTREATEKGITPFPPSPTTMTKYRESRIGSLSVNAKFVSEVDEERIPLLSPHTAALVLIEPLIWARLMKLNHKRFHDVEFEVGLTFRFGLDSRQISGSLKLTFPCGQFSL